VNGQGLTSAARFSATSFLNNRVILVHRSQWLAALVLLGAFVIGGALGFSADHVLHVEQAQGCHPSDARAYWDRIARDWTLTAEQRVIIDSLMETQHQQISALYKPFRQHMDSLSVIAQGISDSTQAQLRVILTPEQRVKMDAMRVEARRRAAQHRACRDQEMAKIR
jgi:Spy/CpxP family protein refolding chaperone